MKALNGCNFPSITIDFSSAHFLVSNVKNMLFPMQLATWQV